MAERLARLGRNPGQVLTWGLVLVLVVLAEMVELAGQRRQL